jgi:hypothetical protein
VIDDRTDAIAREAARLIETGRTSDVDEAVRIAARALGAEDAPRPGPGRVRRHAQAMAMQALGSAAYADRVGAILDVAEALLTSIEHALPDAEAVLVGRAARGTLHVRVYTDRRIADVADALVRLGYEEPAFETAHTRRGRFDRLKFVEEGIDVVVTRCPAAMARERLRDLFTGRAVPVATADDLRRRLRGRARPDAS